MESVLQKINKSLLLRTVKKIQANLSESFIDSLFYSFSYLREQTAVANDLFKMTRICTSFTLSVAYPDFI
jgi:hypothetical protein